MDNVSTKRKAKGVSVRKVRVSYGAVQVIRELDFEIAPGEFIVLLGASGCGKSTLLSVIAGLRDVTAGRIWIGDENVTWAEPKDRDIGMVFQSYALYPQMTVRGNLSFGLRMTGADKAVIEKRVAEAAEILQLTKLLERKPRELRAGKGSGWRSGGRWFGRPMCCSSTNPCPISTPNCGPSCAAS